MNNLTLGVTPSGREFRLPTDAVVQTFATMGIRGAGKTVTATVMAEEMCEARLPWIAFDPVSVWWGLRCAPDGKPGGYPVVVIGGDHADIPLEKHAGKRIAEALMSENVFAVIDLSRESKNTWRQFLTEFCLTLMELTPDIPRHLFIEEAPEFVPQRTKQMVTAQCKEAIERLIRLGRNKGYGCTLITQRPATVDKDVLSQCENLFVMRTTGPHDRKALGEWVEAKATERQVDKLIADIGSFPNGTGYFWSPQWLNIFEKVRFRERKTYHPGATRSVGGQIKVATLSDVGFFVEKLRRQLTKTVVASRPMERHQPAAPVHYEPRHETLIQPSDIEALKAEIHRLREEVSRERAARTSAERRLAAVKKHLQPEYDALRGLFENLGTGSNGGGMVDRGPYEAWIAKAPGAVKKMMEALLDRGTLTRLQLCTLAEVSMSTAKRHGYFSWLKRNNLVTEESDGLALVKL